MSVQYAYNLTKELQRTKRESKIKPTFSQKIHDTMKQERDRVDKHVILKTRIYKSVTFKLVGSLRTYVTI